MSSTTTIGQAPYPGLRPFKLEDAELFFGRETQVNEMLTRIENQPDFRFLAVIGASGSGKSSLVGAGLLPALAQGFLLGAPAEWTFVTARPGDAPLRSLAQAWVETFHPRADPPGAAETKRDPVEVDFTLAQLRGGPLGLVRAYQGEKGVKGRAVLVLIDQFEELFRFRRERPTGRKTDEAVRPATVAASDPAAEIHEDAMPATGDQQRNEAAAFVELLLTTARQTEVPVYVVVTMRSEFLGHCDAFHGLPEAINDSQFLTPRLTRDQAQDAIEGPAGLRSGQVKPALVTRILNEIGSDPDQLPLMQHALLRTWQQAVEERGAGADGQLRLELDDYTAVGGLSLALCNHADQAVAELLGLPPDQVLGVKTEKIRGELTTDAQRTRLRMIEMLFRSLCEQKEEGPLVRRVVSVADVLATIYEEPGQREFDDLVAVVEAFRAEGRNFLVTTPAGTITRETKLDISHEALLRQWTRLSREWVPDEIEAARQFRHYAELARRRQAGQGDLLADDSLRFALAWWDNQRPNNTWIGRYVNQPSLLRVFLEASRAEAEQVQARKLRGRRFRIGVFATVCILLVAATALGAWAIRAEKKGQAEKERSQKILAESCLLNGGTAARYKQDPAKALAWYGQAYLAAEKGSAAYESARRLIASWSVALGRPLLHDGPVSAVTFSPDGRTLATASEDKTAWLWDAATGQPRGEPLKHEGAVNAVTFSPDGRRLATASDDRTARLWDAASGQPLGERMKHEGKVFAVAFSPDGRTLATASYQSRNTTIGNTTIGNTTARLWDVGTGQPRGEPMKHEQVDGDVALPVRGVAFSPDGRTLATASTDSTARLWDAATGQPRGRPMNHELSVTAVTFSPDGRTLATASEDKTARLWDAATGQPRGKSLKHEGWVNTVTFSPDGRTLATASWDRTARLWDVATGQPRGEPMMHERSVCAVTFSPDGRTLATASEDKTARLWAVPTGQPRRIPLNNKAVTISVSFSPDGRQLATGNFDGTARLWDVATGQHLGKPLSNQGKFSFAYVHFSPDGHTLAVWHDDIVRRERALLKRP